MNKDLKLFKRFWEDVPAVFKGSPDDLTKIINGKCDFEDFDDKYVIDIELPGVKKEETEISLKDDYLIISWFRKKEKRRARKSSYEIREGSFRRSFYVEGADPEKIEATLKNGVLSVSIYKKENYKPRLIKIN